MTKGFRNEQDRRARFDEVNQGQQAKELLENPSVTDWKTKQLDKIQADLMNAQTEQDRVMVQARLIELNSLAASLREAIATGAMAEQQIVEDRKRREEAKNRLEVAR